MVVQNESKAQLWAETTNATVAEAASSPADSVGPEQYLLH
jgi:hypothetical protein